MLCFSNPHIDCELIGRTNRFTVEVKVKGRLHRAFITNTGRLKDLIYMGARGFCFPNNPDRRTSYRLFAVRDGSVGSLIDTRFQEDAFKAGVEKKYFAWLRGCKIVGRNPKVNKSRLDYLLKCKEEPLYLEIKSAVLRGPNNEAMYPDCPSLRGRRHIEELTSLAAEGRRAMILFIAGFRSASYFTPYDEGDPEIRNLLKRARDVGVAIKAMSMFYRPNDRCIVLESDDLPIRL